jgi:hypothetical protein
MAKCPNQTGYPENDRLILTQGGMTNGCYALLGRGTSNSAGSNVLPSSSVISTCHPSLVQTRAFATAINSLVRSHFTVSFSLAATIL